MLASSVVHLGFLFKLLVLHSYSDALTRQHELIRCILLHLLTDTDSINVSILLKIT